MPSPYNSTRPHYHPSSSSATDDGHSDPDFPPIRIGTDVPLLSIPTGQLLNRSRYQPAENSREASSSDAVKSGATLRTSSVLNKPSALATSSSKKVGLHCLSSSHGLLKIKRTYHDQNAEELHPPKRQRRLDMEEKHCSTVDVLLRIAEGLERMAEEARMDRELLIRALEKLN